MNIRLKLISVNIYIYIHLLRFNLLIFSVPPWIDETNHGLISNCTVSILFPRCVNVRHVWLYVTSTNRGPNRKFHHCSKCNWNSGNVKQEWILCNAQRNSSLSWFVDTTFVSCFPYIVHNIFRSLSLSQIFKPIINYVYTHLCNYTR